MTYPSDIMMLQGTSTPLTPPPVGNILLYSKADNNFYSLNSSGVETSLANNNLPGGAANQIAYQTAPGATSFVSAPTTGSTFLQWNGSAFAWTALPPGSLTIGSTAITLGTTATTLTGLTSVSATTFTGALTGVASGNLPLAGGTLSGALNLGGFTPTNSGTPANASDVANKGYVDTNFIKNAVGPFASTAALPAVATVPNGTMALVGSAAPYAVYQNNGSAWVSTVTASVNGSGAVTAINGPSGQIMAIDPVTGDVILNVIPRTDILSGLLTVTGGLGEIASATDRPAIVQYNGLANGGTVFYPTAMPIASVTTTPANNIPGVFTTSATYSIGTHFTSGSTAITFLSQCSALPGVVITLQLALGANTLATPTTPLPWLIVQGYQGITGGYVNGASGIPFTGITMGGTTDGARTVAFAVAAAIVATLPGSGVGVPIAVAPSAGTNYGCLSGIATTTAVDAVGGSITCAFKVSTQNGTYLPAGVTGTIYVLQSWVTSTAVDVSYFRGFFQVGFTGLNVYCNKESIAGVFSGAISGSIAPPQSAYLQDTIMTGTFNAYHGATATFYNRFFGYKVSTFSKSFLDLSLTGATFGKFDIATAGAVNLTYGSHLETANNNLTFNNVTLNVTQMSSLNIGAGVYSLYSIYSGVVITVTGLSRVYFGNAPVLGTGVSTSTNPVTKNTVQTDGSIWVSP